MSVTMRKFESFDGTELAWHEAGPEDGRPLLLLHGLFSNAHTNWMKFGTADALTAAGLRLYMLDFRAHGESASPKDAAAYPANVLARDVGAWAAHLGLADFDLAGFSLGGRTAVHAVIGGLRPGKLAVCGMGLAGITDQQAGTDWFLDMIDRLGAHERGSDEYFAQQFMKTGKVDPVAAAHLLRAQVDADPAAVAAIDTPTRVICGAEDRYRADAEALADRMANAAFVEIPGTHMSSVTKPDLGQALAAWFTDEG